MDITLKQLQIFQAVVVAGSITKASRRIALSQPSISQQLAKLEEKLGAQLIQRNRTGVISLTPAGEYWFKTGDDMLKRLEHVVDEHRRRFVDNTVTLRIGAPPALRGRLVASIANIASKERGFVRFEVKFALTCAELVEQLRLHQLNCAIVTADALADDRGSFTVAELFEDPMAWVVPPSVPPADIRRALQRTGKADLLHPALHNFVEIDANVPMRSLSNAWYRHHLPWATPMFSAMTYGAAVDLVAEGLATTHSPLSLLPSLGDSARPRLQIFRLEGLTRQMVLVMPRHLMTLPAYANIYRRIVAFCRTEYTREMLSADIQCLPRVD